LISVLHEAIEQSDLSSVSARAAALPDFERLSMVIQKTRQLTIQYTAIRLVIGPRLLAYSVVGFRSVLHDFVQEVVAWKRNQLNLLLRAAA
jgi:hypothetical protein